MIEVGDYLAAIEKAGAAIDRANALRKRLDKADRKANDLCNRANDMLKALGEDKWRAYINEGVSEMLGLDP